MAPVLATLLATLPGCGYRLGSGTQLPEGIRCVQVRAFTDRTAEGELGVSVASGVRERMRALDPALVAGLGDDDAAVLSGTVRSVRLATVPMGRGGGVVAGLYKIRIEASAQLRSPSGRLVENLGRFNEATEYPVEQGVAASEESRRRALERAAHELGARIAEKLLIRF